jgi:hypothetical protein
MKKKLKSAFLASFVVLSIASFVYVNSVSVQNIPAPAITTADISSIPQSDNDREQDSKRIDLALVQGIYNLIIKFLPAK